MADLEGPEERERERALIMLNLMMVSFKAVTSYSKEIVEAFKSTLPCGPPKSKLTLWTSPDAGNRKLNTDGCWNGSNRKAGIGGIFRDSNCKWILGFYGSINCDSTIESEFLAIYRGLTIILEKNMRNVAIESDSSVAIKLIKGAAANHAQSNIIKDANAIPTRTGAKLSHVFRGSNDVQTILHEWELNSMKN